MKPVTFTVSVDIVQTVSGYCQVRKNLIKAPQLNLDDPAPCRSDCSDLMSWFTHKQLLPNVIMCFDVMNIHKNVQCDGVGVFIVDQFVYLMLS